MDEQLIAACAQLAHHLLLTCPELSFLVTSREPLALGGEMMRALKGPGDDIASMEAALTPPPGRLARPRIVA